jgi:hypothetical protein
VNVLRGVPPTAWGSGARFQQRVVPKLAAARLRAARRPGRLGSIGSLNDEKSERARDRKRSGPPRPAPVRSFRPPLGLFWMARAPPAAAFPRRFPQQARTHRFPGATRPFSVFSGAFQNCPQECPLPSSMRSHPVPVRAAIAQGEKNCRRGRLSALCRALRDAFRSPIWAGGEGRLIK